MIGRDGVSKRDLIETKRGWAAQRDREVHRVSQKRPCPDQERICFCRKQERKADSSSLRCEKVARARKRGRFNKKPLKVEYSEGNV